MSTLVLFVAALALPVILFISSRDWRLTLKAVLVLVVLEGAIRKWVLPQASDQVLLLKDFLLLGAYIRFFLLSPPSPQHGKRLMVISMLLFLMVIWSLTQMFNPRLGSPLAGLWGVKAYLYYIPLIWMLPYLFTSKEELQAFLRRYLLLMIPVSLLGIIQFFSPTSSPLNVYAGGVGEAAGFAGYNNVRITGTFSYLSGYSFYMMACFTLLLPLVFQSSPRQWQLIEHVELALILITSFMTGARTLILFGMLALIGYIGISILIYPPLSIIRHIGRLVIPIIIIATLLAETSLGLGVEVFVNRALTSDSSSGRILDEFDAVLRMLRYGQFDGYGIGASHQAVTAFRNLLDLPDGEPLPPSEGEMGRIMLEIGPVGFLLWYGIRITLILYLLRIISFLRDEYLRGLALSIFLFQAINLIGPLVFNHTFAVYFWFFSGFILLLPKLDQANAKPLGTSLIEVNRVSFTDFRHPSYN